LIGHGQRWREISARVIGLVLSPFALVFYFVANPEQFAAFVD
jgi:hypothetical protein